MTKRTEYMIDGKKLFYEIFPLEKPETLTSLKAIKNVWTMFIGPNLDRKTLNSRAHAAVNVKKIYCYWLTCKFADLKQAQIGEIIGAPRTRIPFYLKTVYNDLTVAQYAPKVIEQLQNLNYYLSLQQDREIVGAVWVSQNENK